jgi:23S rRNA (cytosine1962-C5)-methyltransferase
VEVYTHDKKFVGKGYVNPQSQIMVRLLTRDKDETINEAGF